jgi:chloramphenicol-sensitive protein RarD
VQVLNDQPESDEKRARDGVICALLAFVLWGILPIYFRLVESVPILEVLAHRIIWAVPFGAIIISARHQWPEVRAAMAHRRTLGILILTAILIALNWLVYIYAVQQEQIFQASLGYYINPLLFALTGVFLFGEKLGPIKVLAIALAAAGVIVLAVSVGEMPMITLALAVLFTIYAVLRKRLVVGGMPGLFIETIVLVPFGILYLVWLMVSGTAVFGTANPGMSGLLMLAGPLTAMPLLFFALAARRLSLTTVGMMQFLAPTLQFFVGLYFGEPFTAALAICFICIWLAVSLFAWDAWRQNRTRRLLTQ